MRKLIPAGLAALLGLALGLGPARASDCNPPLSDIHYTRYTIAEGAIYVETNSSAPVLALTDGYFFEALVSLRTNYFWTNAQLVIPNAGPQAMTTNRSEQSFVIEMFSSNLDTITSAYPGGDYQFIVSNSVETVPVPSDPTFPNVPTLSDYAGAQTINPSQDFTLRWNPFVGGTSKDAIAVNIAGSGFSSPSFGCPGALSGTATSLVIPANTLSSNETYRAEITFVHVLTLDTNSTPFVALLAGTEIETDAKIGAITPTDPSGSTLSNESALPDGSVRFDFSTTPATTYTVQSTPTLNNPTWSLLLVTDALGNSVSFTNKPSGSTQFYRVVEP